MPLIEVTHLSKFFRPRARTTALSAKHWALRWLRGDRATPFEALHDISFTVEAGEAVGIIGANGSGKSTLLKILAGVTTPTTGSVVMRGRVVSLLELGAGFHPLLTGRENIYLNGRLLGMTPADVNSVYDDIVAFSGIEEFINNPVSTYSSGMYVRLGFAVAIHANPDVFLVDEVLSVGDEEFQRRCRTRIGELREQQKTIVFVSHDLNIVNSLCDRVILLNKGEMVVRRNPRETIDFYLRAIGREEGSHILAGGNTEAAINNGRLALFHQEREVTASAGAVVSVEAMGQEYESLYADWRIFEHETARCIAQGTLTRLPVTLEWHTRIEDGRLVWTIAVICHRPTPISGLRVHLFLPMRYDQWMYGDRSGRFPDLLPGDQTWSLVVPAEVGCCQAAALPEPQADLPPLVIQIAPQERHQSLEWHNTDYAMGMRALRAEIRIPERDQPLATGRHDMLTLTLDPGMTADDIAALAEDSRESRTLRQGPLAVRFENGCFRVVYDGKLISACVHWYASVLIGNLWNDSTSLRWYAIQRTGDRLEMSGASRRFPYHQHWILEPTETGMWLSIVLDAQEYIEIQEYQVSVGLRPEYTRWITDHESGVFPPFDPAQMDWVHANRNYAPGRQIQALSSSLPSVTLTLLDRDNPFRMTAINTGYQQEARVLQALRTPDGPPLRFEAGRHNLFDGVLSVGTTPSRTEEDTDPQGC